MIVYTINATPAYATGASVSSNTTKEATVLPSNIRKKSARAPAHRKKRRSTEENVDRILRAAADEFGTSGFSGATTATIARNAEVTQAQLFRHFASKTDLFREAIFKPLNQHFIEFQSRLLTDAVGVATHRDKSLLYITELQQFLGEHSKMLLSLVVAQTYAPGSTQAMSEIDSVQTYFARGAALMRSRAVASPKVDPDLMVRVSFAAVLACILFKEWLFPAGMAGQNKIRAAINDFVLDGINANFDDGKIARRKTSD
jgi:AcrR family transcriptional regulator